MLTRGVDPKESDSRTNTQAVLTLLGKSFFVKAFQPLQIYAAFNHKHSVIVFPIPFLFLKYDHIGKTCISLNQQIRSRECRKDDK